MNYEQRSHGNVLMIFSSAVSAEKKNKSSSIVHASAP